MFNLSAKIVQSVKREGSHPDGFPPPWGSWRGLPYLLASVEDEKYNNVIKNTWEISD